jgi:signal transduction histidine kinase
MRRPLNQSADTVAAPPKTWQWPVLDTLTTRFFLLFLCFLSIPLFSLIFFTFSLLQAQVDRSAESQLYLSESAVQSRLTYEQALLYESAARISTGIRSQKDGTQACRQAAQEICLWVNYTDQTQQVWEPGQQMVPPAAPLSLPGGGTQEKTFFALWKDRLYLFAQVPLNLPSDGASQALVLGKPVDVSFINGLYRDNPSLKSAIWMVREPFSPEQPLWFVEASPRASNQEGVWVTSMSVARPGILSALSLGAANKVMTVQGGNGETYQAFQQILYNPLHQPIARLIHLLPGERGSLWLTTYSYGIYLTVLVSLVFSVILAMIVARSITQPLLKLISQVDVLSRTGDFSRPIDIQGVHEIRQLSQAFNRMLGRLRTEHRMKDEFVATLTHDLKVPLLAEKQSLTYIQEGAYGPLTPMQTEVIGVMQQANRSCLSLVNGILEVYRYDAGQVTLMFDQVDVAEVLAETVGELQVLLKEKSLELKVENRVQEMTGTTSIWARADRMEIKRVLTNLLSNAISNTPKQGEIACSILTQAVLQQEAILSLTDFEQTSLVRPVRIQDAVVVSVRDSGIGFVKEDLPYLFTRFAANKGRNPMSIGLGLYNCYQVVHAHGGTLWVETTEGEGAAVSFTLPVSEAVAQDRRKQGDRRKH